MVCVGISPLHMERSFTRFESEITMVEIPNFFFLISLNRNKTIELETRCI